MTPTIRDFHEILSFLEYTYEASRELLGCVRSVGGCFRMHRKLFRRLNINKKIQKISTFFHA